MSDVLPLIKPLASPFKVPTYVRRDAVIQAESISATESVSNSNSELES